MEADLKSGPSEMVDGENIPIILDHNYAFGGSMDSSAINQAINTIQRKHGPKVYLTPLGGTSGGSGIFQIDRPAEGTIIGVSLVTPAQPDIQCQSAPNLDSVTMDQIIIDQTNREISMGAAITLDQIRQALREKIGPQFTVLGADLTSYTYAQSGATFMTGGMGPQRTYFSDSVIEIALHDGNNIRIIKHPEINNYAGTYGWTGLVTAVKCRYHQLPNYEIAFAIPVNQEPKELGQLLAHFSEYAYLDTQCNSVLNKKGQPNIIVGLEHITTSSMAPLLANHQNNTIKLRAKKLIEKCQAADSDGLIFISGFSDSPEDEFLASLIDDPEHETPTIAGVDLTYTEVFPNPDTMREFREAVPFAARTQKTTGAFSYKGHTDANIHINPNSVATTMSAIWQAHMDHVKRIETHFTSQPNVSGEILVYGHLNPCGVDPHNRVTFSCDDRANFERSKRIVEESKNVLIRQLATLCEQTYSDFIGGEKSAGSEYEMAEAFGSLDQAPEKLAKKYHRQKAAIQAAPIMYNWRAMPPYQY